MKMLIRCLAIVVVGTALVAGIQYVIYRLYESKNNRYIIIEDIGEL